MGARKLAQVAEMARIVTGQKPGNSALWKRLVLAKMAARYRFSLLHDAEQLEMIHL